MHIITDDLYAQMETELNLARKCLTAYENAQGPGDHFKLRVASLLLDRIHNHIFGKTQHAIR